MQQFPDELQKPDRLEPELRNLVCDLITDQSMSFLIKQCLVTYGHFSIGNFRSIDLVIPTKFGNKFAEMLLNYLADSIQDIAAFICEETATDGVRIIPPKPSVVPLEWKYSKNSPYENHSHLRKQPVPSMLRVASTSKSKSTNPSKFNRNCS